MRKSIFFSLIILSCVSYSKVVDTAKWNTVDVVKDFKEKYFCNKNLSSQDCDKNFNNMKKYNINVNDLQNSDIKSIKLEKITYQTTNTFPATGTITSNVSGLLMIPETKHPKGVILYYHPTVFDNAGVPSNFNQDNNVSHMFDITYAAIYATNGYIVVAPDYIGQGDDYKNYHPYILYPKQTVNTAIDLLNNVSKEIRKFYNLEKTDHLNLFSVGYSEGGGYSIWTAKCLESPNKCKEVNKLDSLYKYRAAAGLSGAYDVSNITLNFLTDDNDTKKYAIHSKLVTSMVKPALMVNTLISYLYYSNVSKTISIKDFDKDFFEMKCSILPKRKCNIDGKNYTLDSLFLQKHLSNLAMAGAIFNSALYKKYPNQESASHYFIPTGNNSMYNLVNEKIFSNNELINTIKSADIVNFGKNTKTPLYLFAFKEDSIVTRLNYNEFMKNSNKLVTGFVLDNSKILTNTIKWLPFQLDINEVDHTTGESYANLFTYNYIDNLNKKYSNN